MALLPNFIICNADWQVIEQPAQPIVRDSLFCSRKKKRVNDKHLLQVETWSVCCSIKAVIVHILLEHRTGSGMLYAGFGIWPKYGAGIGKTIKALTGSGIWLFPGKRDSPKLGTGYGIYVCVSIGNAGNRHDLPILVAIANQPGERLVVSPFKPNTLWSVWLIGLNG